MMFYLKKSDCPRTTRLGNVQNLYTIIILTGQKNNIKIPTNQNFDSLKRRQCKITILFSIIDFYFIVL